MTSSSQVPHPFPVAINGRPYLLDDKEPWGWQSVPLLRQQADNAALPGEHSINPADLWRRSFESWHHGAGQTVFDRADSSPFRYNTSKGVDPWTKWQLSLLPATASKRSSANTNVRLVAAGARLYVADGQTLLYTTDITATTPTWTTVTGTPAATITSVTSDGFYVYAAFSGDNVWRTDTTTNAAATYTTGATLSASAVLGFVKGRLLLGDAGKVYNLTASGALPAALLDKGANWSWTGFAAGPGHLYASGFQGDKSLVFRSAVKADGTALDTPVVAGELPDGEIVRSVYGYLGFLLVGTDLGVRFATLDGDGNLILGKLIPTSLAVRGFEGQDRFVWFGWSNYDGSSTGLGRLDPSEFTAPVTPAYASDLMATAQGAVLSVVTFQNVRVFTVSGSGVHGQTVDKVASGTVESGQVTYGLTAPKVAVTFDTRCEPLDGSYTLAVSANGAAYQGLVSNETAGSTGSLLSAGQVVGERVELRLTLTRDSGDTTLGPVFLRGTLASYPTPARTRLWTLPVLLHERSVHGTIDVATELREFETLWQDGTQVSQQVGEECEVVVIEDLQWRPEQASRTRRRWNGTLVVRTRPIETANSPAPYYVESFWSRTTSGTLALKLPGVNANLREMLIVTAVIDGSGTIATPAGWTSQASQLSAPIRSYVFSRIVDGSEGATVSLVGTGGSNVQGISALYRNVSAFKTVTSNSGTDSSDPFTVTVTGLSTTSGTNLIGAAVHTTEASAKVSGIPMPYTERIEVSGTRRSALSDKVQNTVAAVPNETVTLTMSNTTATVNWTAHMFALAP